MQVRNKFKIPNKIVIMISCFILVTWAIAFFVIYMIFGNIPEAISKMWEYRGRSNTTASSVTSLSYVFTILISFYSLCSTTFFSILLWKVSKSSLSVSEKLKDLENQRDEEITRENALIVYYDLQRGISNLQDLYISYVLEKKEAKPSKIYFSTDWIKNVANLRDQLTEQELNKVYKLYEQFHVLQNILEKHDSTKIDEELRVHIRMLSKEVFTNFIPLEILSERNTSSVNELVNIDLYVILKKIYYVTYTSTKRVTIMNVSNGELQYETRLDGTLFFKGDNEEPFVGNGKLYNNNGQVKCFGSFQSKHFVQGVLYGYYSSEHKFYEVTYDKLLIPIELTSVKVYQFSEDDTEKYFYNGQFVDGRIFNGFTTLYGDENTMIYQGEIKDGYKDGQGTSYNSKGKKEFEGTWKEDYYYKGTSFLNGNCEFEGEFKIVSAYNGKIAKPWNGKAKNYDISLKVKNFTGQIFEGEPFVGEGSILYLDGEGRSIGEREQFEEQQVKKFENENQIEPDISEIEKRLEDEAQEENNLARHFYKNFNEYIKADWIQGELTIREVNERNKKIYKA